MSLIDLGWNGYFDRQAQPYLSEGYLMGRVTLEYRGSYVVAAEAGEMPAVIAGKLRYEANGRQDLPAVGDWVAFQMLSGDNRALIRAILPRRSFFARKEAGARTEEQVLASNIDTVFLVNALNRDFSLNRLERYLVMAWESGANPVVILNKADLCADVEEKVLETERVSMGVPVHSVSCLTGEGLSALSGYIGQGKTVALLGSSGTGKSTLINRLAGAEIQRTQDIRHSDEEGRHTTVHRQLIALPHGGMLMDTPGLREIQLWTGSESLSDVFADIESLADQCYFNDCKHRTEHHCAVKAAIANGFLTSDRLDSYRHMQRELAFIAKKQDGKANLMEKKNRRKLLSEATDLSDKSM